MDRPDFAVPVAANGYAWWYLDAISDDGRHGLTVIAFVGSVFSPYYAWARAGAARTGQRVDPENHVAINAVLYGPRGKRWAMTERGRSALQRSRDRFSTGPSAWRWDGDALTVDVDEIGVPWPRRLRGSVRVVPDWLNERSFELTPDGAHAWQPYAPRARVEARFSNPALQWRGSGYLDGNRGQRPLQADFRGWNWSRLTADRRTEIVYALQPRAAAPWTMTLHATDDGRLESTRNGAPVTLPPTRWRIGRSARAGVTVTRTLEDTPFYARSEISGRLLETRGRGVHESLDLDRLSRSWVNWLLPFRMPRRPGPPPDSRGG